MAAQESRHDLAAEWRVGGKVLGEFVVERVLGRGGFGEVVLVQAQSTGARYAVKRLVRADPLAQRDFLTETQRWMALPSHPHLVECHFVRTVGAQMVVFSEYVAGGSLADLLAKPEFRHPSDPRERLRTMLGVALDTARGLDVAHTHGLLHLDVKPGNILLAEDGTAKVTDFGLAAAADDGSAGPHARGLTPAYASPEQLLGRSLGRGADLWAWAVMVLEMCIGRRTWEVGAAAGHALEQYRDSTRSAAAAPAAPGMPLPEGVARLLGACFQSDEARRPGSMREVARELARIAERECGIAPAEEPEVVRPQIPATNWSVRRQPEDDVRRSDTRDLLWAAYDAAGLDPMQAAPFQASGQNHGRNPHAVRAVEDLRALTEALDALEAVQDPQPRVIHLRAMVLAETGRLRERLEDLPGAIQGYRASMHALDSLPTAQAPVLRLSVGLALAIALRRSGASEAALDLCDLLAESASALEDAGEAAAGEGRALLIKANVLSDLEVEDLDERAALYVRATARARDGGDPESMVLALAGQAEILERIGHGADADALWEQADRMIPDAAGPGRTDAEMIRGRLLLNRALLTQDLQLAGTYAAAAAEVYETLVNEMGHREAAGYLAQALQVQAQAHERAGRLREALAAQSAARDLLEGVVLRDGLTGYAGLLAEVYQAEALLVQYDDGPGDPVDVAARAVGIWERVLEADGRPIWWDRVIRARASLGGYLAEAGRMAEAAEEIDRTLSVLREVPGGVDVHYAGAFAHRVKAILLRRTGNPDGACRELYVALETLGTAVDGAEQELRVMCLQTLSGALADSGRLADSLAVLHDVTGVIEQMADKREVGPDVLAETYKRQADAQFNAGYCVEAARSAAAAVSVYEALATAGRTDVLGHIAKLRCMSGTALKRLGDLDGADREFQAVARSLRALPAAMRYEIDLGDSGNGADMLASVEGWIATVAQVRTVRSRDIPRLVEAYGRHRAGLLTDGGSRAAAASMEVSARLDDLCGNLIWLTAQYSHDALRKECMEAALMLGAVSTRCGREGAAERGLRLAMEQGQVLVIDRGRTEHVALWSQAYLLEARRLAEKGDTGDADRVISEMERHLTMLAPARAGRWAEQARREVADAGQPRS
jgi:tetratricopeptide (TPR) repeat protein